MKNSRAPALLVLCLTVQADADVWKWVDANGKTHYVDTMKTIYTWIDEFGKVHYSDTPEHEDAVTVELAWHSAGTLEDLPGSDDAAPEGTDAEAQAGDAERDPADDYFCRRATEIYESYVNAPQLYRSGPDGEREYLSEDEAARTIAETRARKEELCNPQLASSD